MSKAYIRVNRCAWTTPWIILTLLRHHRRIALIIRAEIVIAIATISRINSFHLAVVVAVAIQQIPPPQTPPSTILCWWSPTTHLRFWWTSKHLKMAKNHMLHYLRTRIACAIANLQMTSKMWIRCNHHRLKETWQVFKLDCWVEWGPSRKIML